MVLNDRLPRSDSIRATLKSSGTKITDLSLSGKFLALRELLYDCGIGVVDDDEGGGKKSDGSVPTSAVSQHRALVFCQWRATVDLLVDYLNQGALGDVSFLRLDGSTPVNQRQVVVDRFNADPSIDLLLLTTHIGGLGLNLTGADVVIFVDHDWNPVKDLQAIDRAHRLGQKR
uniref:Helicase C-terminal domain-containing protein n=1 Tax=Plectus sambesii TaxID=2011161 RepID=A0A914VA87_9BILA